MVLAVIEILMVAAAFACLALAVRSAARKGTLPKIVAVLCCSAGTASLLSMMQMLTSNSELLRVVDVFYFLSIDVLMFSLFSYACELHGKAKQAAHALGVAFGIAIAFDLWLFILNANGPVMVDYTLVSRPEFNIGAGLERVALPPFRYHLALDYAMVAVAAVALIQKTYSTPKAYRGPYASLLAALAVIFIVNVLYMSGIIDSPTDCSCIIYVVGVFDLYWVTFFAMRNNRYSQVVKTITYGSKDPIVLFGHNACLVTMNEPAREIFDVHDNDWDPITLYEFAEMFDMPVLVTAKENCCFAWSPSGGQIGSYLCEFTVAKEEGGRCLGYGITMRKASETMDGKTGLYNEESFRERRGTLQETASYPVLFTSISLSYVSAMNGAYGRAMTDASIGNFARCLRAAWPATGKSFMAYRGASEFEVITRYTTREQIVAALEHLRDDIDWGVPSDIDPDFEYGIIEADGSTYDAVNASRKAHELAEYKLYASPASMRSNNVSALVSPLIDRGFTTQSRVDATSRLTERIAKEMGVDELVTYRSILLSRLSDIGKVAVPDSVAFHTGTYTRGARLLMERHAEVGYRLLKSTAGLSALAEPLLHHHENWDGSGYPDGLKGEQIPIESRIVAVATAFDEKVSGRPGSVALSFADAIKDIASGAGTLFDPRVVRAFLEAADGGRGLDTAEKEAVLSQVEARVKRIDEVTDEADEADEQLHALIVDDQEMNRCIITMNLEGSYECTEAVDGVEALDLLSGNPGLFDVVLLDLIMPNVSGREVLSKAKEQGLTDEIPFIVVTADDEVETWKECLDMGAAEVLSKPVNGDILRRRVDNAVELFSTRKGLQLKVERQAADIMIKNEELRQQAGRLERTNDQVSSILHNVMDYRDCDSAGHLDRVMSFTVAIATEIVDNYPSLGLKASQIGPLGSASALHDIGKVAVPDSILFKVGPLDDDEFAVMKAHTVCGYNLILEPLKALGDDDFARFSLEVVRSHHERWDGSGYPDGLKGREIPLSAQIASLADVYDALTSKRPYKEPYSHEKAVEMILNGECGAFSSTMIEVFKKVSPSFPKIAAKNAEEGAPNQGEQYRKLLTGVFGDINGDVVIDNGASMEHMVHMLMDANRDLKVLNQYDMPTGTFNRNAYTEYLSSFNTTSLSCMSAVYFDVNGLHEYNRDYGHAQGDVMLANVARAIMDAFEKYKTFRTGGDEFVTVCENATEEETLSLIENARQLFAERGLSCSIGYDWRESDLDMDEMVKAADKSMFQQKAVFYEGDAGRRER